MRTNFRLFAATLVLAGVVLIPVYIKYNRNKACEAIKKELIDETNKMMSEITNSCNVLAERRQISIRDCWQQQLRFFQERSEAIDVELRRKNCDIF